MRKVFKDIKKKVENILYKHKMSQKPVHAHSHTRNTQKSRHQAAAGAFWGELAASLSLGSFLSELNHTGCGCVVCACVVGIR